MDLNDNSNWVELEESDEDELLSDFENNDEENIDDDYFKKYVDVGVEDVLDEVVRSSQLMMVGHNETEQRNMVEVRKENDLPWGWISLQLSNLEMQLESMPFLMDMK